MVRASAAEIVVVTTVGNGRTLEAHIDAMLMMIIISTLLLIDTVTPMLLLVTITTVVSSMVTVGTEMTLLTRCPKKWTA